MGNRIADIIKKAGIVAKEDLAKALEFSQLHNMPLGYALLKNNMVNEAALMKALAEGFGGMEVVEPHDLSIENSVISCVPRDIAIQYRIIPINRLANNLFVAMGDPSNISVIDKVSTRLGVTLRVKLASELSIQRALEKYYLGKEEAVTRNTAPRAPTQNSHDEPADNYVVSYIDRLLQSAVYRKASDIHIEPYETAMRVRLRIDGVLIEYDQKPRFESKDALISRIKILSNLDIGEKRLPQDGNVKLDIANYAKMDFRVSCLPTVWGEKIVLRLLDKSNLHLDMTNLGFDSGQMRQFTDAIMKPYGMVIVTGPTGSGKTTTLYSALSELNRVSDNVVTIEDPVEYTIPGICQVQVKNDIELTFAKALKAFLRQDPDVIMVGEIRDAETAEISMKAALTGHIVLTTVHTNNAPETIERLKNLQVSPFTLISAINAIVAQRLVRRICVRCKTIDNISPQEQINHGIPPRLAGTFKIYKGVGCMECNNTGYKGRAAIYEVLTMDDTIKQAIASGANSLELKKIAMQNGMQTLRQSAWKKVYKGITSMAELLEATATDMDVSKMNRSA